MLQKSKKMFKGIGLKFEKNACVMYLMCISSSVLTCLLITVSPTQGFKFCCFPCIIICIIVYHPDFILPHFCSSVIDLLCLFLKYVK